MTKIIQNLRKNEYKPMKIVGYNETASVSYQDKPYAINVTGYKTVRLVDWNPDQIPPQIIDIAKGYNFVCLTQRLRYKFSYYLSS